MPGLEIVSTATPCSSISHVTVGVVVPAENDRVQSRHDDGKAERAARRARVVVRADLNIFVDAEEEVSCVVR